MKQHKIKLEAEIIAMKTEKGLSTQVKAEFMKQVEEAKKLEE